MTNVLRRDRLVDLAALLLILIGIALYFDSASRFHAIMAYSYQHPGPRGHSQLDAADRARYESYAAAVVVSLGCIVGVVSAWRHARRRRPVS
jgi:hypothetical protein